MDINLQKNFRNFLDVFGYFKNVQPTLIAKKALELSGLKPYQLLVRKTQEAIDVERFFETANIQMMPCFKTLIRSTMPDMVTLVTSFVEEREILKTKKWDEEIVQGIGLRVYSFPEFIGALCSAVPHPYMLLSQQNVRYVRMAPGQPVYALSIIKKHDDLRSQLYAEIVNGHYREPGSAVYSKNKK